MTEQPLSNNSTHFDLEVSDEDFLFAQSVLLIFLGLNPFLLLQKERSQTSIQLHHSFIIQLVFITAVFLFGLRMNIRTSVITDPFFIKPLWKIVKAKKSEEYSYQRILTLQNLHQL